MADRKLTIKLHSLVSAADLNGSGAKIVPPKDPAEHKKLDDAGRVKVLLESGRSLSVKRDNIEQANEEQASTTVVVLQNNVPREITLTKEQYQDTVAQAHVAPVPNKVGLPLGCVYSGVGGENFAATWVMINPQTGFAPSKWKDQPGDTVVVRTDGEDFTQKDWSKLHDFLGTLLDVYPEDDPERIARMLTPKYYASFKL